MNVVGLYIMFDLIVISCLIKLKMMYNPKIFPVVHLYVFLPKQPKVFFI